MVIVNPTNTSVTVLKGLHLYHGAISNCSMRVRMTLIEKGLEWTSHHLDLVKKENVTDAYFGIHPAGLVPALVHDGVVHIESNDIIAYLDETFPEPTLRATQNTDQMDAWLDLAGSIHMTAIKPYIYFKRMSGRVKKSASEEAEYMRLQKNEEMREFHRKFSGSGGIDPKDVAEAEHILEECFTKLDRALEGKEWIMGDQFTLADISWIPVHFTMVGAGYPFEKYPNVTRWADALHAKTSFKEGIETWCADFAKA